jgi:ABC-type multidrug transport system fused ATPase/permease subunit
MSVKSTVRASLDLLSPRDRRVLVLVTAAQMSTAFLDLLGILLIGVVTALSVSAIGGGTPPEILSTLMSWAGLSGTDVITAAVVIASVAGFVLIAKSVVNVLLTRRILRFLAIRQALVSGCLAAGLLSKPLLQVQRRSSQETAYALTTGVNYATLIVLAQGVVALTEVSLLLVLAIGLLAISPVVTAFTVAFFVLIAVALQRILSTWAGQLGVRSSIVEVSSYSAIQEALRTYREIVVSHRRSFYVERFQALRWETSIVQSDIQFLGLIPKYVFEVALVIGAGLLAASQLLTRDMTAAIATIAIFLAAGSRVVPSMLRLQSAAILIRGAQGQAQPTFVLAQELEASKAGSSAENAQDPNSTIALRAMLLKGHPDFDPNLSVEGVELTYPGTMEPALRGVSIQLHAGTSMALVGSTGAGKSTLADVILGVLAPESGEVKIGGLAPMEAIARWPGAIAYVPQDVSMVNGNVRENVALGLPVDAIDDDWVWDALERAHLANFLRASRDGLETIVGEHGLRLSGGQRQRLGVARALYARPKFLVLDEATSALDAETEQLVAETLRELSGSVTTVTIAHRLATIRECDLVVYMESGRVVASGTFDEVRALAGDFDKQARLLGL